MALEPGFGFSDRQVPNVPAGFAGPCLDRPHVFSFARVSAVLEMKVSDFYENGRRRWFRLLEKAASITRYLSITRRRTTWPSSWKKRVLSQTNRSFKTFRKKQPTGRANVAIRGLPDDPAPGDRCRCPCSGLLPFVPCHRDNGLP
jgi:hypothetical protein